jgi:feruloyl esterase
MMRGWHIGLVLASTMLGTAAQAATADCANLAKKLAFPDAKVKIIAATRVPAAAPGTVKVNAYSPPLASGLPAYCKVEGVINERTGAGGKKYGIGFEVALPENWNGRFLYQGGGGLNGTINPPIGQAAAGDKPALARGFAVVATDGGHKGAGFDASFKGDQQAALDFAQSSVGTMTPIAKKVVATYYGRPAAHSYFAGCSTGGREAMLSATRFPDYFDGILAGAPAMRTGNSNIGTSHAAVAFNQAAPRDAEGKPIIAQIFSPGDKALLIKGLLDACDGKDGLKDGVIDNVKSCQFKPAVLACTGAKTDSCLSGAQVKALEVAFSAPKDAAGAPAYAAFPYDTGIVAAGGGIPGLIPSGAPSPLGAPIRDLTIDIDARLQTVRGDAMQVLTDTYGWSNLNTFTGHGGKIIFYHGVSDPWFSANDTADYVERAAKDAGGTEKWAQAGRLYMAPGMGHCGGGANTFDTFDMLSAVVEWVEDGKAPQAITAQRTLPSKATRPMCPFPAYPHYRGGDAAKAESFECRAPEG